MLTKKIDSAKFWIAKNKPLVAVGIVVTATVAAITIDVLTRDNSEWIDTDAITAD
jgi:hypothetical protein